MFLLLEDAFNAKKDESSPIDGQAGFHFGIGFTHLKNQVMNYWATWGTVQVSGLRDLWKWSQIACLDGVISAHNSQAVLQHAWLRIRQRWGVFWIRNIGPRECTHWMEWKRLEMLSLIANSPNIFSIFWSWISNRYWQFRDPIPTASYQMEKIQFCVT